MDLSPFDPTFDLDGKRVRSLSLYGVGDSFRASDGAATDFDEITRCAMRFLGADGAAIAVWTTRAVVLARHAPGDTAEPDPRLLDEVWRRVPPPGRSGTTRPDTPYAVTTRDAATTWWSAVLVGQEEVPLGLLTSWHAGAWQLDVDQQVLLRHLGSSVVAVLERMRHLRRRRQRPDRPGLRTVGGPDRRLRR